VIVLTPRPAKYYLLLKALRSEARKFVLLLFPVAFITGSTYTFDMGSMSQSVQDPGVKA
jgi:hypothetical protein